MVGRWREGWSRALSGPGGCAGGCCTDTLLRRHAPAPEPGEGLQPAGQLLPALPGSAPGRVSACMAVAKSTPCTRRGARAGCSPRCKGTGSPSELPAAVGACPRGARATSWGTAGASPLLRAPGAAEAQPELWEHQDPPWGLRSPSPSLITPAVPEQPGADSRYFPQFPHSAHAAGEIRACPSSREGHEEPPMASQPPERRDPPSPAAAGPAPASTPAPSFGGALAVPARPGWRQQSPRRGAWLTSESWLRRGRSGREGK